LSRENLDVQRKILVRFKESVSEFRNVLLSTRSKSLDFLKQASQDSISLIESSIASQEDLDKDLKSRSREIKDRFTNQLKKETEDLYSNFKVSVSSELESGLVSFKEVSKESNNKVLEEVKGFVEDIHDHILSSHESLNERLELEYKKIDDYLNTYKKEKIQDLEKNFDRVVKEMVSSYLKRSLDIPTHEEIIREIIKSRVGSLEKI
jgi:F0F1-type ATP synthase membrane subunit b/b'